MSKDIKVEVIYYKSEADVSLEFGLHGDYPLRLLSSSCNDIQTFFKKLKHAVQRSEIIITVGGYGKDRLPEFIGKAVGKKSYTPDYRSEHIITDEKYALPEGAIPLAPKSKRFAGFLMECGPQTIISLTDNRKTRLDIVEQFVVGYITEHHCVFNAPRATVETAEAFENQTADINTDKKEDIPIVAATVEAPDISEEKPTDTLQDNDSDILADLDVSEMQDGNNVDTSDITTFDSGVSQTDTSPTDISENDAPEAEIPNNFDPMDKTPVFCVTPQNGSITPQPLLFDINEPLDGTGKFKHYGTKKRLRRVRLFCLIASLIIAVATAALLAYSKIDRSRNVTASVSSAVNGNIGESSVSDSSFADSSLPLPDYTISRDDEEDDDEPTDNEYYEDMPDVILPPLPTASSDIANTSSAPSPSFPSVSSSGTVTSQPSSSNTTSEPSTSSSETTPSSAPSSTTSSVSSVTSSAVSSSSPSSSSTSSGSSTPSTPKPNIDPIYTWDITLYVIDSATGISYSDKAVNIIAMIIEDEMSPTIDPKEALIAQSIAAYNWLINNGARFPASAPKVALDPNPYPQAFEAAEDAKGSVLMYGNTVARTNYYAYSAGKTANTQDIWGGTAYPYLQSVDCSVDESLPNFITTKTYSSSEIQQLIKDKCDIDVSGMDKSEWIKPIKYDSNGLYLISLKIGEKEYKGQFLRSTLLSYQIRSTAVTVAYDAKTDTFTFTCKGYGHGVGMSQRGAKSYAKLGWTHEQILLHFFTGTTLVKN